MTPIDIEILKKIQNDYTIYDGFYIQMTKEWCVLNRAIKELKETVPKDFVEKITDEIIDNSFCSDIFNDRTDIEIIKLDTVLDIIKRNLGGE